MQHVSMPGNSEPTWHSGFPSQTWQQLFTPGSKPPAVQVGDIVGGDAKKNVAFCTQLFNLMFGERAEYQKPRPEGPVKFEEPRSPAGNGGKAALGMFSEANVRGRSDESRMCCSVLCTLVVCGVRCVCGVSYIDSYITLLHLTPLPSIRPSFPPSSISSFPPFEDSVDTVYG